MCQEQNLGKHIRLCRAEVLPVGVYRFIDGRIGSARSASLTPHPRPPFERISDAQIPPTRQQIANSRQQTSGIESDSQRTHMSGEIQGKSVFLTGSDNTAQEAST
jgi:hypothetical protein